MRVRRGPAAMTTLGAILILQTSSAISAASATSGRRWVSVAEFNDNLSGIEHDLDVMTGFAEVFDVERCLVAQRAPGAVAERTVSIANRFRVRGDREGTWIRFDRAHPRRLAGSHEFALIQLWWSNTGSISLLKPGQSKGAPRPNAQPMMHVIYSLRSPLEVRLAMTPRLFRDGLVLDRPGYPGYREIGRMIGLAVLEELHRESGDLGKDQRLAIPGVVERLSFPIGSQR